MTYKKRVMLVVLFVFFVNKPVKTVMLDEGYCVGTPRHSRVRYDPQIN